MGLLIIGASGFIGSVIYKEAIKNDYIVTGTEFSSQTDNLVHFDLQNSEFRVFFDDNMLNRFDAVVICAAIAKINRCYYEKDLTWSLNVEKTCELIDFFRSMNKKIIYLSSDAVFDGLKGYYDENDLVSPLNQYGHQKAQVENHILEANERDVVIRTGLVVSNKKHKNQIFSEWYELGKKNKPIICIENQIISPTFVGDIGKAVVQILERDLSGLYHVSNPEYFERAELAYQFSRVLNLKTEILVKKIGYFNFPEERAIKTYLDSSKFRNDTQMSFRSMKSVIKEFSY